MTSINSTKRNEMNKAKSVASDKDALRAAVDRTNARNGRDTEASPAMTNAQDKDKGSKHPLATAVTATNRRMRARH